MEHRAMSSSPSREEPEAFSSRQSDVSDMAAMQEFIDDAAITRVLGVVKSGKEATVYRCRAHKSYGVPYLAAKVYHDHMHRGFQRAREYMEGRVILAAGQVQRAVEKRTEFGRSAEASMWVNAEFDILSTLGYAGADVPEVYACTDRAILMEYVGDGEVAAPHLQHADIPRDEAPAVFERLLWNIELAMRENIVHGDLSPFNILYRDGRAIIIDFPQAVDPRMASAARKLLERDIRNVTRYFARYGIEADPQAIADDLWERFTYDWSRG
jgi:RIO kinase 1